MGDDLKPCPFCGGALETRIDSTFNIHYAVHVPDNEDCPLSNDEYLWANPLMRDMNKEDLINKLNTRPLEDALQKRIAELESENKALRLIAGSHSMSELRRKRIMAGDKWFKYPEAPRGEE